MKVLGGIKERWGSTLSAKFMLGFGAILLCVMILFSFVIYDYLSKIYIGEAYEKADLVLGQIDARMEYIRDELRPQIFHVFPGNVFIQQVMSTSLMNKGIMDRFKQRFPRYTYRRVALDPMNPANKADAFEAAFIKRLRENPGAEKEKRGLIIRGGKTYFIRMRAIVMKRQCLLCHGDPVSSPPSITARYGKVHGRHWKVGDIVGLESISIPVSRTFHQLEHVVFYFFLFWIVAMAGLFVALNYFHYKVAVVPLRRVSSFFKEVVSGQRGLETRFSNHDYDEVADLADSFNRMMGHLRDSEEEKRAMKERVLRADKMASIGQLAAGVAHEINNPLSMILGYTKSLRNNCPSEGEIHENLNIIYNNARLCKTVIEDLLSFSRQPKAEYRPVDVNAAIDEAAALMEESFRKHGVNIIRDYSVLPPLPADETRLKLVFSNLLINAFQAMKSGGTITVKTEFDTEGKGIRINFSDTGCGIPEEIRDRIFEPFFTTKPVGEGSGLGLAVSQGLIKELDGEISVRSGPGAGAAFTLWFPLEGDRT